MAKVLDNRIGKLSTLLDSNLIPRNLIQLQIMVRKHWLDNAAYQYDNNLISVKKHRQFNSRKTKKELAALLLKKKL